MAAVAAFLAVAQGCSTPPPVAKDDLALGDDKAKSESSSSDAPEGNQRDSVELGSGTKGTNPSPEPARGDDGDDTASSAPATCTKDAECNQIGRICTAGACVKGCRSTAQCPTNQTCSSGQCNFVNASVECYFDVDCELGAICVADACKPGCHTSFDCPTGQSCAAGMCKAATTTTPPPTGSTPCSSDG